MPWQKSDSFKSPGPALSTTRCGVGGGGTSSAARPVSRLSDQPRPAGMLDGETTLRVPTMSYRDAAVGQTSKSCSLGGGAEAAVDADERVHVTRRVSGGPVRPGQLEDWQAYNKPVNFDGKGLNWSKQIPVTKKPKAEKCPIKADINRSRQDSTKDILKEKIRESHKKVKERCVEFGTETRSEKMIDSEKMVELSRNKNNEKQQVLEAGDFNLNNLDSVDKIDGGDMLDTIDMAGPKTDTTPARQIVKSHSIGFKNYGNTCYLNGSLQALLGLPMVVTEMLNIRLMVDMFESREGLVRTFWKLCSACTKGEVVQANLEMKEIKIVMELLDKQFEGTRMQDASEFLVRFIDELSEDLDNVPTKLDIGKGMMNMLNIPVDNLVKINFRHEREEFHVCCNCTAQSSAKHSDMAFWCDTVSHTVNTRTRSVSLQRLLEQNFAMEKRERRCEECGCETAITSNKLVNLPRVIIIYLKRYKFNNQESAMGGKVSRVIDIPETVCLTSMVAETVTLPSTVLPTLSLDLASPPPLPTLQDALHNSHIPIPAKFSGLTQAALGQLSEEDQLEYLLHVSQVDALSRGGAGDDQEDKDIIAALDASMKDGSFNQIISMTDVEFEPAQDSLSVKLDTAGDRVKREMIRTPAQKRAFGQVGWVGEEAFENHRAGIIGIENKNNTEVKSEERRTYSRALKEKNSEYPQEINIRHPKTKDEEEADLKEALERSILEDSMIIQEDVPINKFQWAIGDTENNNNEETDCLRQEKPEHCYQLSSVVSHHGLGASSGHYVADVFRFDVPGWFRYDDTRVTSSDITNVRNGSNTSNGYIFTYLYQPLWDAQCRKQ